MSSISKDSRKFRIEGSDLMLDALVKAIEQALRAARSSPDRTGKGSATAGTFEIEVEASSDPDNLSYVISSLDDAVRTVAGWAEPKLCEDCEEPVALLFDDAYLESSEGDGVVCCRCYRLRQGDEDEP
ncbi:MAG TPA: hypothetical protein VE243_06500 [Candidatus Acidoferrum sp.]|nr:hypothetical protein [Candidatus Acidoferrum sp.]